MKILLIAILFTSFITAQNGHLNAIDMVKMNYTKDKVLNWYEGSKKFELIKDDKGILVYKGGDCFIDWPVYLTVYSFNDKDEITQVVVSLADTTKDDAFLFPEVLNKFRQWYGREIEVKEVDEGMRYYYWYFGDEMKEADRMMFVSKNMNRTSPTVITQVDLRKIKLEDLK